MVTPASPLNQGPKEQVEDLLDVLCAQPTPVIHQHQTEHVQGQVSQSCLRVCQKEEGQMKKPSQGKSGEKHHPKLILFSPAWLFVHTQMTCCSPNSLGPCPPHSDSHLSRQPQSPTKDCTKGSVPYQLNSRFIKSQFRDGHVPKTGESSGDGSQEEEHR